ncbi:hypothetical protein ACFXG4_50395, partial [Nocardia sp. NPDC059246]|uniref:hypothetical protein n=1 Tax=Nocardia sp. NPDC059246 TaxID=3346789 RepID=UPI003699F3EE
MTAHSRTDSTIVRRILARSLNTLREHAGMDMVLVLQPDFVIDAGAVQGAGSGAATAWSCCVCVG